MYHTPYINSISFSYFEGIPLEIQDHIGINLLVPGGLIPHCTPGGEVGTNHLKEIQDKMGGNYILLVILNSVYLVDTS